MFAYAHRETLELLRDPIRMTLAILGSLILMFVLGYGIYIDVENLVLRGPRPRSRRPSVSDYALQISGSRYFSERPPITDLTISIARMDAASSSLAIEIPPGFGRDVARGNAASSRRMDRRRQALARRNRASLRGGRCTSIG